MLLSHPVFICHVERNYPSRGAWCMIVTIIGDNHACSQENGHNFSENILTSLQNCYRPICFQHHISSYRCLNCFRCEKEIIKTWQHISIIAERELLTTILSTLLTAPVPHGMERKDLLLTVTSIFLMTSFINNLWSKTQL